MKDNKILLIAFLLIILESESVFAQDSFNTQLLFETSITEGDFTDVIVEDNYIYAIVGDSLKLFELTNQNSIRFISKISLFNSTSYPTKLLKQGSIIVVLFSSKTFPDNDPGGIKIFEIDAYHKFKFLSNYDIKGFKFNMVLTDKYIFVAAGESGLHIIDYQNPSSLLTAGRYNPGGYSTGNGIIHISVSDNIASVSMSSEGLDIIDITNISQPQKLYSMFQTSGGVTASILTYDFLYVFLQNSSSCEIYNISDLQNVSFLSRIPICENVRDVSIDGNYLFISEYGTQIINISNKTNPFYIGFTSVNYLNLTHNVSNSKIFVTSYSYYLGNYIYKLAAYSFNNLNSKITLNQPSSSVSWLSGESESVNISAYNINSVDIEVSPDSGTTWQIIVDNYPINGYQDIISFIVPQINSQKCLLRVSDSKKHNIHDISPITFTIKADIVFDSPKAGTFINEVNIVWSSQNLNRFSLYYNIDNSSIWEVIEEDFIDTTDYWKHYKWQFQNLNSENVKIKIVDFYNTGSFDISPDITLKSIIAIGDSTFDSLDTFYPLQIGNIWQYHVTNRIGYQDFVDKGYDFMEVLSDTIIGEQSYFKIKTIEWNDSIKYLRYDSLQSSISRSFFTEEVVSFKLNSKSDECWLFEGGREICNKGTYLESIFGSEKPVIHFYQSDFDSKYFHLAKDFGLIWMQNDQSYINTNIWIYDLVYAKIGDVEYGTYVSVKNKDGSYPQEYVLSQNYPNPFNPTTKIKYSIPVGSANFASPIMVELKVYNVLGREVATLVNKRQPAGSFEVEFNSSTYGKKLTSGVYFYRLKADNFVETKKMLLLR